MIAIDTSALMAIILNEADGERCAAAIEAADRLLISAGTLAEALIVAERRNVEATLTRLVDGLGLEVVPVTATAAQRIAAAYNQWGKGLHPAGLNFGDCFAYEIATANGCPLLFVGNDFGQTDVLVA